MSKPSIDIDLEQLSALLNHIVTQSEDPNTRSQLLVDLKARADMYWGKDPRVSFIIAQLVIAIANLFLDDYNIALGTMSKGDSLRFINRIPEAHKTLHEAGQIFKSIGDEIGWARTRIGYLLTSHEMGHEIVQKALEDVDYARKIFLRHNEIDLLVRLSINLSAFHEWRRDYQKAREALIFAIDLINEAENIHHARLLQNLGIIEQGDGNYAVALECYKRAEMMFDKFGQTNELARVTVNRSSLWMLQGNYRQALNLMKVIHPQLDSQTQLHNICNQISCYQLLGAHDKARRTTLTILNTSAELPVIDQAWLKMFLGESLAESAEFDGAIKTFNDAETLLQEVNAPEMLHEIYVRRADMYIKQGKAQAAITDAEQALQSSDLYIQVRANLVLGYAALLDSKFNNAIDTTIKAFVAARKLGMELLNYQTLILMGRVREAENQSAKAFRYYQRANKRALKIQRGISKDYRPGYLQSNQEAYHSMINIALNAGDIKQAFSILEDIKSLVVHQNLHENTTQVAPNNAYGSDFQEKLQLLRNRYLEVVNQTQKTSQDNEEKQHLEQDMVDLIAESRLHNPPNNIEFQSPSIEDIRNSLPEHTGLIEYYSHDDKIIVFMLARNSDLQMRQLDKTSYSELNQFLRKLRRLIGRALAVGPQSAIKHYLEKTNILLKHLYDALIAPCCKFIDNYETIVFVPYGVLHSIPFNMLYDGTQYLIEKHPLVSRPSSGHADVSIQSNKRGVLALGYNEGDDKYRMEREAQNIVKILGGNHFINEQAVSQQLSVPPYQVLHLAAHGIHTLNEPRLSHIRLADGLLFMDDLWQFNLSYELVVLSACQVGLSNPSGGDELIGLGHSFLYAGASSLVSSLWDVDDEAATIFTRKFYNYLKGEDKLPKSVALQETQIELMQDKRFKHPAYWGAFQLQGNPEPLH